jgi:hypothetical protein
MMEIPCPHCGKMVNPASLLAKAGKGVPRRFTAKERERRALRLAKVRRETTQEKLNEKGRERLRAYLLASRSGAGVD